MAEIKWQFQAAVAGGPSLSFNQPVITVDAYDVVQVALPDGASGTAVSIQPSSSANQMALVVIASDQYGAKLTYKVDSLGTTNKLDGPHIFVGPGAVAFLNPGQAPNSLTFSNSLGKTANVSVLVGRTVS